MSNKIVVGLDIGTTKIACFVGRQTEHGKIEILSMGHCESHGVKRGVVSNIELTVQSIVAAVKEAALMAKSYSEVRVPYGVAKAIIKREVKEKDPVVSKT